MFKTLSKSPIFFIFISYIIFLLPLLVIGGGLSRLESYILTFASAGFSIFFLSYQFYRLYKINILVLGIVGYFLKLFIGLIFWQLYMWPGYFSSEYSQIVFDHFEYLFTILSMEKLAEHRIEFGPLAIPNADHFLAQGKYIFINYILSNLYMSGNTNMLDYSIQNTLFSFYTAIAVSLISFLFGLSKKQIKIVFLISFFQPFSMISVMLWRDVVGQFFFVIGIYILLLGLNKKIFTQFLSIFISTLSMGLLRNVYIAIPIFVFAMDQIKKRGISLKKIILIFTIILFISFLTTSTNLLGFLGSGYSSYLSILDFNQLIMLPYEYFRLLLGPFPWTNWFKFDDMSIFYLVNYLQAVYVICILYFVIKFYKSCNNDFKSLLLFVFLILITMASLPSDVHTEYYSFGAVILLPIAAHYITIKKFVYSYFLVFSCYLILNLLYLSKGFIA